MAGSQLKRLKSALKEHGLIGPAQRKKASKDPRTARLEREQAVQTVREAFNPFDIKKTRQKSDVLGRSVQGATGKPGISKQIGEESRRRAYELKSREKKAGGVVDRRFGENDKNMTPEEKMLARFTREKLSTLSKNKSSLFSLDDDLGEDEGLTHYGKSLSLTDDFADDDLGDSNDEDEEIREMRKRRRLNRDGDEEDEDEDAPNVKKSKKEVMQEVIAKSKMYKYERQQAKQEDLDEIDELDAEMDALYEDLSKIDNRSSKPTLSESDLAYEQNVREMAFDRRAAPADRTKTDEEIAKEKADRLRSLEEARQARMDGYEGDGVEELDEIDEDDSDNNDAKQFGFTGLGSDAEESDGEEPLLEDEFADSDGLSEGESDVAESDAKKPKQTQASKLPYPETGRELQNILSSVKPSEYAKTVSSIIEAYHPRRAEGNKEKLAVFSTALVDYILLYVDEVASSTPTTKASTVLDDLIGELRKLAPSHTETIATHFREELVTVGEKLALLRDSGKTSPSVLFFFTLVGVLFSTSDHYHLIATSAALLMAQHLSQTTLVHSADAASSLYLCSTLVQYQRVSKRYVPEVPLFLAKILSAFSGNPAAEPKDMFISVVDRSWTKLPVKKVELRLMSLSQVVNGKGETFNYSLLSRSSHLVSELSQLWRDKTAFIEIFEPLHILLEDLADRHVPAKEAAGKLSKLLTFSKKDRRPLSLQSHRPVPLQSIAPKFEDNYNVDKKSYDPDAQRNELNKLKAEIKKERKGALRDLRRDNSFVAREKLKSKRVADAEYHQKLARLERSVATEEGAEKNKYEREKAARKRKH